MKYLAPAIIALFAALPASGEDTPSKHKLSDWKIGPVLFGDEPRFAVRSLNHSIAGRIEITGGLQI